MEDELRLSLLVVGTFFILAVLAHGIWKIRKGSKSNDSPRSRIEPGEWSDEDDELDADDIAWNEDDVGHHRESSRSSPDVAPDPDYDDLGLGKVRVISGEQKHAQPPAGAEGAPVNDDGIEEGVDEPVAKRPDSGASENEEQPAPSNSDKANRSQHTSRPEAAEKLYGSVVTNPKPHMQSNRPAGENDIDIPEPPGFLLRDKEETPEVESENSATPDHSAVSDEVDDFSLDPQPSQNEAPADASNVSSFSEQARRLVGRKKSRPQGKKRQEPSFGDDQMRIDFEETVRPTSDTSSTASASESEPGKQTEKAAAPASEQEVLVLNVRAPEDEPISGAALLPMLLTLGFKFGDQDIFHRHVNSNGKGPVLFSLANMFKPGIFDIDNLETFTTQGVSLFMILPIEGDPHQVFNMMHNAARKIADEFHAQVLDGRRSVLTKQGLQQYIEKIREFERQRMISRH
ncbi:cell division protein ZipA [Alteromonas sp. H39]|uniref:cell division protein ZipA n=1 Tax=Alteromonas sp. H39 TaxID=3389876 RepID=UPI0039E0ABAB